MSTFERPHAENMSRSNQEFIVGEATSIIIEGGSDVEGTVISTEIIGSDTVLVLRIGDQNHSYLHRAGVWSEQAAEEKKLAA